MKWKWIAEGFISTKQGSLYQEAESCFNELVNRSMILQVDVDDDGGFARYCQVHDMVLDLIIISLSNGENFATVLSGAWNSFPSKIRRLSLQSSGHEQNGAIHIITRSKLHVRSLNVFGEIKHIPPLAGLESLRVLDIFRCYHSFEDKHMRNIGSFYQLRYLKIRSERITELPEDIGKLQNLERLLIWWTLQLENCHQLYSSYRNWCVYIFVTYGFVFSIDMFRGMLALEEVSYIHIVDNPEEFLEELGHLTKLRKISMSGILMEHEDECVLRCYRERLGSCLNELGKYNLQYLNTSGAMGEYLFRDPCCTFPHLQDLKLGKYKYL
ncbi:hypothetical protein ACQJBY_025949 [Aegilops geniculata]